MRKTLLALALLLAAAAVGTQADDVLFDVHWKALLPITVDGTYLPQPRTFDGGCGDFIVQGTFDSATVTLEWSPDNVNWYTVKDTAATDIAPTTSIHSVQFCSGRRWIRLVVAGGGGSLSLSNAGITEMKVAFLAGLALAGGDLRLNGHLLLPQENDAVTPTLGFGDGDTGIYEKSDDNLAFSTGGVERFAFDSAGDFVITNFGRGMIGANANSAGLFNVTSNATTPTLRPNRASTNTGRGGVSGEISDIIGGVETVNMRADGLVSNLRNVGAFPPATCPPGATWIDTDDSDDTNCTTSSTPTLCCCHATDTWAAC